MTLLLLLNGYGVTGSGVSFDFLRPYVTFEAAHRVTLEDDKALTFENRHTVMIENDKAIEFEDNKKVSL